MDVLGKRKRHMYTRRAKDMTSSEIELHRDCTRFSTCSVNKCPFHPMSKNLHKDCDDPELKCTLTK